MTAEEWFEKFKKAYIAYFGINEDYLSDNDEVVLEIARSVSE